MNRPALIVVVALLFALAVFLNSFTVERFGFVLGVAGQVALGVFAYRVGLATAGGQPAARYFPALFALTLFTAGVLAALLSPAGDPYSFFILMAIDIAFATTAFALGRSAGRPARQSELLGDTS